MKKAIVGFILFILVIAIYSFWTDFSLILRFTQDGEFIESIKRLVGYNVPETTDQPVISKPRIDSDDSGLGFLNVPEGFRISIAAKDLDNPRVILFDAKGRMLVSETKAGRVRIIEDKDNDGKFETKNILIENLRSPHGLAFFIEGETTYLYIAETHQVARYRYDIQNGKLIDAVGVNIATLPPDGQHFTRTIALGPNWRDRDLVKGIFPIGGLYSGDKLYISVGSSCDVCLETTWKRGAILESDPQGTFTGEFAGGLRNSVFFTFHPETKEIWATEMGRDELGDDLPPDEINIVKVAGPEHKFGARRFGWPFCYGNKVKDETFKPEKIERIDIPTDCSETDAPVIEIPAHSAPLGLAFVTSDKWPSQWQNDLLVAYHGSWNRSEPTGYKIVRFKVDKNGKVSETADFITGWLALSGSKGLSQNKKKIYGRPVDLRFGPSFDKSLASPKPSAKRGLEGKPDGALYISDDAGGIIYKLEQK